MYVDFGINQIPYNMFMARVDYAPDGVNRPRVHPHAPKLVLVQEGTLYAGFVDSNNTLFSKILYPGDVFVIPLAMVHFQINIGKTGAVTFASFNSQNPGTISIPNSVFGTNPPIDPYALARAFQIDVNLVKKLMREPLVISSRSKYTKKKRPKTKKTTTTPKTKAAAKQRTKATLHNQADTTTTHNEAETRTKLQKMH